MEALLPGLKKGGRGLRACKRVKTGTGLDLSLDSQQHHPAVHLSNAPPVSFGLYTSAIFLVLVSLLRVSGKEGRITGADVDGESQQ